MPGPIAEKNFYEVLQVDHDANAELIRQGYRKLMQQLRHHPDLGGDTATAALINKAYATLGDTARRAEYDARLDILRHVARGVLQEPGDGPTFGQTVRDVDPLRECPFCRAPHDGGNTKDTNASCGNCGSPLSAADNIRFEPSDKRAVERLCRHMDVAFFTHWRQSKGFRGQTEDISLNGLRLVSRTGVRTGQHIRIVSNLVEAVGLVTHCVPKHGLWRKEYVAGVSFVTLRFVRSVGAFLSQRA